MQTSIVLSLLNALWLGTTLNGTYGNDHAVCLSASVSVYLYVYTYRMNSDVRHGECF